jgi:predicted transcriptional regulator
MIKKLIALRLDLQQLRQLQRLAKKDDRSVSYIIRKAIDAYIRKERQ